MYKTFLLAARNIYRHRQRTALAMIAIVFGVVALLLAGGFIEWGLWFGRDSTIHSQLGHIQITRKDYYRKGVADPFKYLMPQESKELNAVARLPDVKVVGPRLSFSGLLSWGDSSISFLGEGIDPASEGELSRSITVRKGANLAPRDPNGVILGQGLAANLGADVGATVVLLVTTASGGVNAIEFTVRGIFSTITKAYDDATLRIPIETARELLRVKGAHVWVVLLKDDVRTTERLAEIRKLVPADQYEVLPWRELADFYNKTEALLVQQFSTVKAIIGLIILLSISNTMMMTVMERTGEIGTMMALGVRRRAVLQLFLAEGLLLGVLGGLAGLVLGFILAQIISLIGIPMPPAPGMADPYTARIMLTGPLALQSFGIAVLTTLIASIYPAWKAGGMAIVDALRVNR